MEHAELPAHGADREDIGALIDGLAALLLRGRTLYQVSFHCYLHLNGVRLRPDMSALRTGGGSLRTWKINPGGDPPPRGSMEHQRPLRRELLARAAAPSDYRATTTTRCGP